jgi:hypothetical protein
VTCKKGETYLKFRSNKRDKEIHFRRGEQNSMAQAARGEDDYCVLGVYLKVCSRICVITYHRHIKVSAVTAH